MGKRILMSGIIAFIFITLTGWNGLHAHTPFIWEYCFVFHLIPFGIGFSGGQFIYIILYYILLWLILSLFIFCVISAVNRLINHKVN
jgi:hypothetical protein